MDTYTKMKAPAWLTDPAKTEFARALRELQLAGVEILQTDLAMLATYAQAFADVSRLALEIRKTGELVEGYRGSRVKNPLLTVLTQANARMTHAAGKLGLSPGARRGIRRGNPVEPIQADSLESFMRGGRNGR